MLSRCLLDMKIIIKADILKSIEEKGLEDKFGEILIPSAKTKAVFQKMLSVLKKQYLFPGYMLIEMEPVPEALRLVSQTPRISRFLGGKDPLPLSPKKR